VLLPRHTDAYVSCFARYLATDVTELFDYMVGCCMAHPLFEKVPETDYVSTPIHTYKITAYVLSIL
jgi:tRNA G46 methylase TrmB